MIASTPKRHFVNATLLASSMGLAPTAVVSLLSEPDAAANVFSMLKSLLPQLDDSHAGISEAFTDHLRERGLSQPLETFAHQLASDGHRDLDIYVTSEFVRWSNYLAFANGQETQLTSQSMPVGRSA